jgi:hypothetical protein
MQPVLFLGNGVNLLTRDGRSWSHVLQDLSRIVDEPSLVELIEYKPFTLVYEGICSKYFQAGERDDVILKEFVAELLDKMGHNLIHRELVELGARHILTTNYDYCLERSVSEALAHDDIKTETRYSLFRATKSLATHIWHIHGEIEKPNTIMLGHEQYGGYLQKLRGYLTSSRSPKSPFVSGQDDFEADETYSWADIFLRDEIHILGFGFDYSEIDLWWLLSFKSRLQKTRTRACGPTYYYHWTTKAENDRDRAKVQLLQSLGVNVREAYAITDFSEQYERFISGFGAS